jgi:hypothetical protein
MSNVLLVYFEECSGLLYNLQYCNAHQLGWGGGGGGVAVSGLYCKISQKINAMAYAVLGVFSTNSYSLITAKPLPARQETERKRQIRGERR